jgi:AcrR family transcriptional regulator
MTDLKARLVPAVPPTLHPGPRRQQKEERREQILDATLRVFSEKGYSGASMRDIAREVGVTEGLLYHYFESKEQLMNACWKERSWRAQLEKILAGAEGVPLDQVLREMIGNFLETLRKNSAMVRLCASEMQHNAEMAAGHVERIEDNKRLIRGFLQARQAAGEIRPDVCLDTPSGILMGCAYSMFLLWGDSEQSVWEEHSRSLVEHGVDVIMNGISPRK